MSRDGLGEIFFEGLAATSADGSMSHPQQPGEYRLISVARAELSRHSRRVSE
jgi:hypothetical protein